VRFEDVAFDDQWREDQQQGLHLLSGYHAMLQDPTMARPVRVRIAPSPTGDPHVGTAYMALFNYVFAKKHGGQFVLRIEDTDQTRARSDSEQMIFDAVHWLGLSWDEGPDVGGPHAPYRQSERKHIYTEYIGKLLDSGHVYRCFCTEDRLAKLRAQQQAAKQNPGYDRHCRDLDPAEARNRAVGGEPNVIRLKMPTEGPITFHDELRGDITRDATSYQDQILIKSDGMPTYHFAACVDDHLMEISHVIRAEEWISTAGIAAILYGAFGWEQPKWIHMPLLRNNDKDKSKISKRKHPVSINYYRDTGILPQALVNFLGTMGWSFGGDREKFTLQEMIDVFTFDRISLGGPVFDMAKLISLNEKYIHEMTPEQLADTLLGWRLNKDYLVRLMSLAQKRIKKLDDFIPLTEYFFSGDLDYKSLVGDMAIPEVTNADVAKGLLAFVERFEARDGWSLEMIEQEITAWIDSTAWNPGRAKGLLRLAVTGRKSSPEISHVMTALGKEITRRRLREAAAFLSKAK
jgi:glutamyl-tRNA synthetase